MHDTSHLTTRRGFIAATGFGGTALYALWVGYGAAPGPTALFAATQDPGGAEPPAIGLTPEEFQARVQDFVARFGEADGSVRPRAETGMHGADPAQDLHAGHAQPAPETVAGHGGHGAAEHAATADVQSPSHDAAAPVEIWLEARQFYFEPAHLRLATHQAYRFRMMAMDVSHGASIQFGSGGRMIRLRPGQMAEVDFTLREPGEFLIYCTYYCGAAHDVMQARLSVTERGVA